MAKRIVVPLLLAVLVGGCTTTVHYNRVGGQSSGQDAFNQSNARCQMEAAKVGGFSALDRAAQQDSFMANCLYVDGWRRID